MRRSTVLAAALALSAFLAPVAWCESVLIPASADNTLYDDGVGALSNGMGQHMFAGTSGGGARRRAVLRFPVSDSVPAGATVNLVELRLNVFSPAIQRGRPLLARSV